jgi:3-oxoadipate enol-lactonase
LGEIEAFFDLCVNVCFNKFFQVGILMRYSRYNVAECLYRDLERVQFMPRNTEIVSVAGADVVITRHPDKPLLILSRMASRGMGVWDTVWDRLAECFSVANFDLRAPDGDAMDRPGEVFSQYAGNCAGVADALGYDGFHVLGWNGGSHVALQCAADHPDKVRSCVLIGAFFELPDMRAVDKGVQFMRVMLENQDPELYSFYWFMAGLSPDFVARNFDQVETFAKARASGDVFVKLDVARIMKWVHALRRYRLSDAEMGAIKAPTLIVAPELDRWNAGPNVAMAREVHERIRGSKMTVIPDAGSLIPLEDPERFLAAITPFFDSVLST